MKREYEIIILLEKILNTLNNSRLEYLKAADRIPVPKYKRFLNKTSTIRNKFCQEIMVLLRVYNAEPDNLFINKINFEKTFTSPYRNLKTNCSELIINLDDELTKLYEEIIALYPDSETLEEHYRKILDSMKTNMNLIKDHRLVFHS